MKIFHSTLTTRTMYLLVVLFVSTAVASFAFVSQPTITSNARTIALNMGWFDKAFHGSGSASNKDLDDMWEAQQEILRARHGVQSKEKMQQKYKSPTSEGKFQVKPSKDRTNLEHMNAMYVDDKVEQEGLKFPWDQKKKK
jgi:hypothetical protein